MSQYSDNTPGHDFIDIYYSSGNLLFGGNAYAGFAEPAPGVWTHVAIVSNSGNVKAYYNGVQVYNYAGLNNNLTNGTNELYLGQRGTFASSQHFNGELTDIRISNSARYTTAFDPMSVSLAPTRDANTKLLLTPKEDGWFTGESRLLSTSCDIAVDYPHSQSLQFSQSTGQGIVAAASSDWNLDTTWSIEFWIKAPGASNGVGGPSSGIWGLFNQAGWSSTNNIVVALSDGYLKFLSISNQANADVSFTEPTPGVWTHVAIVNNAGTQKVWYNGVEQTKVAGTFGTASYTNSTDPLYIGSLSPTNGSSFNGKLAMIRISNTAKYTGEFIATTTYGVEADTKLFLGKINPVVDSKSHTMTINSVTPSTDFPTVPTLVSIAITPANSTVFTGNDTTVQFTATGTYSDSRTHNITNLVTWDITPGFTNYGITATGSVFLDEGLQGTGIVISASLDGISATTLLDFG
jgi:hypothetical protein